MPETTGARRHAARTACVSVSFALTLTLCLAACAAPGTAAPDTTATATGTVALPPAGAVFDYQLGGAYPPRPEVTVVARDRRAAPQAGVYSICYINAFQTQPGESDLWPDDLLLRDAAGEPVTDPDWPDEILIDTRSADRVAAILEPWIEACAAAGFAGVEYDNLDTYTRSDGALSRDDALTVARALVAAAHARGLAAGQKNAAEDTAVLRAGAVFDFAVAEECVAFHECDAYRDVYGEHVLAIEYPDTLDQPFSDACATADRPASLLLRDRSLTTPGGAGYLFETCP